MPVVCDAPQTTSKSRVITFLVIVNLSNLHRLNVKSESLDICWWNLYEKLPLYIISIEMKEETVPASLAEDLKKNLIKFLNGK